MHRHKCHSRFHEGPRVRTHYDDRCTEHYDSDCLSCHDEELAAQGAAFQYHDDVPYSDTDPGL